jgi:hypothetical protein
MSELHQESKPRAWEDGINATLVHIIEGLLEIELKDHSGIVGACRL